MRERLQTLLNSELDLSSLNLREINYIIFPDWTQPEDELGLELQQVIQSLATHPNSEKTTLLIDTGNITGEDAELFLSSVVMNLLVQEDLDVTEGLEISLVENFADIQWSALLPRIHARIVLEYEDKNALSQAKAETLTLYEIESLSQVPAEQFFLNWSNKLFSEGRWKEAIAQYQKLLEIQSGDADIYWNFSYCYKQLNLQDEYFNKKGRGQEAEGRREFCFVSSARDRRELGFKSPTKISDLVDCNWCGSEAQTILLPSALCLLPSAFFTTLQQGLKLYPTDGRLHFSLIIDLRQNGRIEEAILSAENAAKCLPDDYTFQILKYLTVPLIYENQGEINFYRQRYTQGLRDLIEQTSIKTTEDQHSALAGIGCLTNFYLSYQAQNDIDLQCQYGNLVHEIMGVNYPQWVVPLSMPKLQPNEKIRIGYVSHYLHSYSGTFWLTGWLRQSNHESFEIYCYYTGNEPDPITQKFQEYSDVFHHIPHNLSAACEQIIADKLHILVFPEIGMNPQTMQMAGLRLAPVQCVAWGHPVTTGLPTIDYFLSSELMEPQNGQEHYSEKLILLPNIGVAYPKPYIPPVIKTRSDYALSDDVIYLCCQAPFKYLPQYDFILAEIACRIPQAKFIFLRGTVLKPRLQRAFAAVGLNSEDYCIHLNIPERLDYLMINLLSDVYLDTFTWSGGNTSLEAIASNLPIVTCPGEFMRGRHSDSFLKMLGVTDTIAENEIEYIEIAVKLGLDPVWRRSIAEQMSQNHDRLFDDKACVAGLEAFYIQVVETSSLYCHDRNYH
ncbi:O-linked N-acetylglucosamine transferase, SPINDLY family protein [Nostoc sp.]|uniref:O-linked N-acetylglucosamine transferase, SPINDLY family protein n=1 Tax=Nostoc sp. TaxID=1180 RepID=UPI002FFB1540